MTKIAGSGSISHRHGSADPDPPQNVMDPQHCQKPDYYSDFPLSLLNLMENRKWRDMCMRRCSEWRTRGSQRRCGWAGRGDPSASPSSGEVIILVCLSEQETRLVISITHPDHGSLIFVKTPNPKCRLCWCLIEFTDWRYSQSCWYFRPLLRTSAPLALSPVHPCVNKYRSI